MPDITDLLTGPWVAERVGAIHKNLWTQDPNLAMSLLSSGIPNEHLDSVSRGILRTSDAAASFADAFHRIARVEGSAPNQYFWTSEPRGQVMAPVAQHVAPPAPGLVQNPRVVAAGVSGSGFDPGAITRFFGITHQPSTQDRADAQARWDALSSADRSFLEQTQKESLDNVANVIAGARQTYGIGRATVNLPKGITDLLQTAQDNPENLGESGQRLLKIYSTLYPLSEFNWHGVGDSLLARTLGEAGSGLGRGITEAGEVLTSPITGALSYGGQYLQRLDRDFATLHPNEPKNMPGIKEVFWKAGHPDSPGTAFGKVWVGDVLGATPQDAGYDAAVAGASFIWQWFTSPDIIAANAAKGYRLADSVFSDYKAIKNAVKVADETGDVSKLEPFKTRLSVDQQSQLDYFTNAADALRKEGKADEAANMVARGNGMLINLLDQNADAWLQSQSHSAVTRAVLARTIQDAEGVVYSKKGTKVAGDILTAVNKASGPADLGRQFKGLNAQTATALMDAKGGTVQDVQQIVLSFARGETPIGVKQLFEERQQVIAGLADLDRQRVVRLNQDLAAGRLPEERIGMTQAEQDVANQLNLRKSVIDARLGAKVTPRFEPLETLPKNSPMYRVLHEGDSKIAHILNAHWKLPLPGAKVDHTIRLNEIEQEKNLLYDRLSVHGGSLGDAGKASVIKRIEDLDKEWGTLAAEQGKRDFVVAKMISPSVSKLWDDVYDRRVYVHTSPAATHPPDALTHNLKQFESFMKAAGVQVSRRNEVLDAFTRAKNDSDYFAAMKKLGNAIKDSPLLGNRGGAYISAISKNEISSFFDTSESGRLYGLIPTGGHGFDHVLPILDARGNRVAVPGGPSEMINFLTLPDYEKMLDFTSATRRLSADIKNSAVTLGTIGPKTARLIGHAAVVGNRAITQFWKDMIILSRSFGAFQLRVIGEENVRMWAYDKAGAFNSPGEWFRYVRNKDELPEWFNGRFLGMIESDINKDLRTRGAKVWIPAYDRNGVFDAPAFLPAWSGRYAQLATEPLVQELARNGPEEAKAWLKGAGGWETRQVMDANVTRSWEDSGLAFDRAGSGGRQVVDVPPAQPALPSGEVGQEIARPEPPLVKRTAPQVEILGPDGQYHPVPRVTDKWDYYVEQKWKEIQALTDQHPQLLEALAKGVAPVRDNEALITERARLQTEYDKLTNDYWAADANQASVAAQMKENRAMVQEIDHDLRNPPDAVPVGTADFEGYLGELVRRGEVKPPEVISGYPPGSLPPKPKFNMRNWMYEDLIGKPDSYLSRKPLYRQFEQDEFKRLKSLGWDDASARARAQIKAARSTADVLYDLGARTSAQRFFRQIAPFAPAWQELLETYLWKIPAQSFPGLGHIALWERAHLLSKLANDLGIDFTGVSNLPFVGTLFRSVWGGAVPTSFTFHPDSANFITAGGGLITGPPLGPLSGAALAVIRPHVKNGIFDQVANFLQPFGPDVQLGPTVLNRLWEAMTGKAAPWELQSADTQRISFNFEYQTALNQVYLERRNTQPKAIDFAPINPDTGKPDVGKMLPQDTLKFQQAMAKWMNDLEGRASNRARVWSLIRGVGSAVFPAPLSVTDVPTQEYRKLNDSLFRNAAIAAGQPLENMTEAGAAKALADYRATPEGQKLYDDFTRRFPGSEAYLTPTSINGLTVEALPNQDLRRYSKILSGAKELLTDDQRLNLTMYLNSRAVHDAHVQAIITKYAGGATNPIDRAKNILHHYGEYKDELAAEAKSFDDYTTALGKDKDSGYGTFLSMVKRSKNTDKPQYTLDQERMLSFLGDMNEILPLMEEGGIKPEGWKDLRRGILERLDAQDTTYGPPKDPTLKALRDYLNSNDAYFQQTDAIYRKIDNTPKAEQGPLFDKLRALQDKTQGRNGFPSPEEFIYLAKTPQEQAAVRERWATRPPEWLSHFQRQTLGYQDAPNANAFIDLVNSTDEAVKSLGLREGYGSNAYADAKAQRLNELGKRAAQLGLSQLWSQIQSPPYRRLMQSGVTLAPGFGQLALRADFLWSDLRRQGVVPGGTSEASIAAQRQFFTEVQRFRAQNLAADKWFTQLEIALAPAGKAKRAKQDLYAALFFDNWNGAPAQVFQQGPAPSTGVPSTSGGGAPVQGGDITAVLGG